MMEPTAAHRVTDRESKGTLYVVATPIGNLRDATLRAIEVLKSVAVIAAEDTRVTAKLLHHYGIAARLVAVHAHNEKRVAGRLLECLAGGQSVALVSDAGTPAISDPGAYVVGAARAAGYRVSPVPGASAAIAALSVAGFASPHFLFYGFLPQRRAERRRALEQLRALPYTLVFYEAPHRVGESLAGMCEVLGAARRVVIARELTKLFETVHECTLADAAGWLAEDADRCRGEFVLIVEGAAEASVDHAEIERVLSLLLDALPLRQAVELAAKLSNGRRNELYAMALKLDREL